MDQFRFAGREALHGSTISPSFVNNWQISVLTSTTSARATVMPVVIFHKSFPVAMGYSIVPKWWMRSSNDNPAVMTDDSKFLRNWGHVTPDLYEWVCQSQGWHVEEHPCIELIRSSMNPAKRNLVPFVGSNEDYQQADDRQLICTFAAPRQLYRWSPLDVNFESVGICCFGMIWGTGG